jgi:hypothetical protein
MKNSTCLILGLYISILTLNAQHQDVLINGEFQNVPLRSFIQTVEQNYPVLFFFEWETVDTILIHADFQETPLKECLESILYKEGLNFHISGNNQVTIYMGAEIKRLFPEDQQIEVIHKRNSPDEAISRDNLKALPYQMMNIGTPGSNRSGTALLSGYLTDFENKNPVAGANIFLAETHKGVISNVDGYYEIRLPLGNQTVHYSSLDMHATSRIINLYSDGGLDVVMETKYNLLEDVVVFGRGKGNLGQIHLGVEKIDIAELKSMPSLMGEPDVIKSLINLPGVQTVGEGTAGFNVRGGKTDQNLILIDQAPIYYPFHFFGNFSAINTDIVRDASLYKGSMPVRYGGRISSVLDITTIDGDLKKFSGAGGISPVSARLNINGPFVTDSSTFLVSYRGTYSNWLLDYINVPSLYNSTASFYDLQGKLNLYVNPKNQLLVNFYKSKDKFQLQSDSIYEYNNNIASLAWQHQINRKMNSDVSLIYSGFSYSLSDEGDINTASRLTHRLEQMSLKGNLDYYTNRGLELVFGGEAIFYSVNPGEREVGEFSNVVPIHSDNERAVELAVYAGNEFFISDRLKIEAGLRVSGIISLSNGKRYMYAPGLPKNVEQIIDTASIEVNSIEQFYVRPEFRFSANYSVNRYSSLKLSYNKTVQYIHMLSNTSAISPTDTWKLSDVYLSPQIGHQVSSGYFRNFRNNTIETSVEVFYKIMHHVKEYKPGADLLLNDHIETEIIDGDGKSYGAEFSLKKPGGRFNGRIDYTYSRTFFRSVTEFPEELINGGEYYPANYDKPHSLNVLLNVKASRRLIFSATLNYSTGRPITYPMAKYKMGDQVILHYSDYNQYRIPDYFRMDLALTIDGNLKKKKLFHSSFTISLYNLTGRNNAYSIYFRSEEGNFAAYKLSIFGTMIPTVSYNFRF